MPLPRATRATICCTGGGMLTAAARTSSSPSRRWTVPAAPPCVARKRSSQTRSDAVDAHDLGRAQGSCSAREPAVDERHPNERGTERPAPRTGVAQRREDRAHERVDLADVRDDVGRLGAGARRAWLLALALLVGL